MGELRVEEVASAAGLDALAPAWTRLWCDAAGASPFQSPAWLIPWWRHFGQGQLVVLCARERDELRGLLPLYLYDEPPLCKLLPLGIGNSDWLDVIGAPGHEREVARTLLAAIAQRAHRFDVCDLQPLPAASLLLRTEAPGLADERVALEPCPVLRLPGSVAGLDGTLPKPMRQNLRYCRRRAEKQGRLRFETAHDGNLHELLEALFDLHGARWRRQGRPGVLADDAVRAFHREATPALLAFGVLRLHGLRLGERIVAVLYGFAARHRFYHYLLGFDPDLGALSPGTLLIGRALEEAVREGAQEFDFLRGREAYKYRWGARDRPSWGRRLRAAI